MFINYYFCPECGTEWVDAWSCMCDDRCPSCNKSCSPFDSEESGEDEDEDNG